MPFSTKIVLAGGAIVLALGSAAFSKRPPKSSTLPPDAAVTWSPVGIDAFALAKILADAPPDTVVIALDQPHHALRGSMPMAAMAASDDALVQNPPKTRRVVLAAFDQVRADKLARRLLAKGVETRVLIGGLEAWDRVMDADPPAPPSNARAEVWQTYRTEVALRHAFGDASLAPAAPAAAPIVPIAAPAGGGAGQKHEGC